MKIVYGEASFGVVLLHKALGALGFAVSRDEVSERRAGEVTREKLRDLKTHLGVATDHETLVDPATTAAMQAELGKRGLVAPHRSFTVSGTVRQRDGSPRRRQQLVAFDVDLRGVAIQRTVTSLAELVASDGFDVLGAAVSDSRGTYRITFYDWQYRRAERKKADVVVFALESDETGGRIIGRSRLVNSDDYSEAGIVYNLDLTAGDAAARPEYELVMEAVGAFLKESGVKLTELSTEQLAFTASELDLELERVGVAAAAARLVDDKQRLSHELLYALGRQAIALDWSTLQRKRDDELATAIEASIENTIVRPFRRGDIEQFLAVLRETAVTSVLAGEPAVKLMLESALPEAQQRTAFLRAVSTFGDGDASAFWHTHLPAQPELTDTLVSRLVSTQQLTMLTGNHQPLVRELVARNITSREALLDLGTDEWVAAIERAGVPEGATGDARAYAGHIEGMLNAAFPTQRIARMVAKQQLPIVDAEGVAAFLAHNPTFDIATSRVHDFDQQLGSSAARRDVAKLQRVFQVSTRPEVMATLMKAELHSARAVAGVPLKSFIAQYGNALGGDAEAIAIHQRASHVATRIELAAAHVLAYANGQHPALVVGAVENQALKRVLENAIPDYERLFGSPDICECEHCRSVYSPAAYFVDLLRFLWRGEPNSQGRTPLEMLAARRPDLLHLPLSCENTNTIIPYVDLANEVMEYYVAHDSLATFTGYDTGTTTREDLRANPQHFDLEAYRKLKDARHPFTLPYHQPLDVIRAYSDHLRASRDEVMRALHPVPDATTATALAAETLRLSQEEVRVIAGTAFDGTADATPLHACYGYATVVELEGLSAVPELKRRTGIVYVELVELVKTHFLNPHRGALAFVERLFARATIDANALYARLEQIEAGTLDPATDAAITTALTAYNAEHGTSLTPAVLGAWVIAHLGEVRQVITLFEPQSRCDLETTRLRTIASIYEAGATSGITNDTWSRMHRFIRLWRKLGWTIHDTDLVLTALGEAAITDATVRALAAVARVRTAMKLPLDRLAALWGDLDVAGEKSLYAQLFLDRAVQELDEVFQPDPWGNVLQDPAESLADHQSAILAAFRASEDDLGAILEVARIDDGGGPRPIDLATDTLNLRNLSTLYRHVVLARALKLRAPDCCKLIALFGAAPFDGPEQTLAFVELVAAIKASRFKVTTLEYVFTGALPADSTLGLDRARVLQAARDIRQAFATIELDHPTTPPSPLAREVLAAKLALTFQPDVVTQLLAMLDRTATFEAVATANLTVVIPESLAARYTYVRGSGRLRMTGIMSEAERAALKALAGIDASFEAAVDQLYAAPEQVLAAHFDGVLVDLTAANAVLLDHPAQIPQATMEARLVHVYSAFVPLLKSKLRRDAITQHVASLVRLGEQATALLIAADVEALVGDLSTEGHSGTFFADPTWTTQAVQTIDPVLDFAWGTAAPNASTPPDNFSARWQSYLAPPASGEYTLVVSVAEPDDAFRLYQDDVLLLEKTSGSPVTSLEVVTTLNAARMHRLSLEYAEQAQNAGIRVEWKTATSALEVLPAAAVYPATILDAFVARVTTYHRATKLISGFGLTDAELDHLLSYPGDFGNLDFAALRPDDWRRIDAYVTLRKAVPQARARLTDVFAAANQTAPAPALADLKTTLHEATAWDRAGIDFLVDTQFGLTADDFKNEIAIERLRRVMRIVERTGLSAHTIAVWGAVEMDFDALHATAQLLKHTVKATVEERDWLALAGKLSDGLRNNQQRALVAYLLTRPAIQAWGAADADALFEYFLIDVQMDACMDTSRIVQASSSVQMFVNRCLLNLESELTTGAERGVSPAAIDRQRWDWLKAYRVWEANRKVFLYPENWLEPEWRNDRSELFRELESYLVQNDINERSVEQAFRNYLTGLNEVANLEVCGIHRENHGNGKLHGTLKYMHVFGRTQHSPYRYYYRRWDQYRKWSAWEKVGVDVRTVEAGDKAGARSGVHLLPVVWKNRLFLFWPEIMEKRETPPSGNGTRSFETTAKESSTASLQPILHWEIKLAWSEYVEGTWTPKQVSKEFIYQYDQWYIPKPAEKTFRFASEIDEDENLFLYFLVETYDPREWYLEGAFELTDIAGRIVANSGGYGWAHEEWDEKFRSDFQSVFAGGKLELLGNTYFKRSNWHWLLPAADMRNFELTLDEPFFFRDPFRTYFVRPVATPIIDRVKDPTRYLPYLPLLENPYRRPPRPLPGPDDFLPLPGELARAGQPVVRARAPIAREMTVASARDLEPTGNVLAYAKTKRAFIEAPFAYTTRDISGAFGAMRFQTKLEFNTFYHPFSSEYVTQLNRDGIDGLMSADTTILSDNGKRFEDAYDPNFGRVKQATDVARTDYKENVCFDVYGANSSYNWELFFHAPLYIATRLSRNGQYEEAMKWFHYIFDPTTDELPGPGETEVSRYWKVKPFKTTPATSLEDWFRTLAPNTNPSSAENAIIAEWRDNPFDPHLVASNRPLAYMKSVVLKYVENLVAWGDSLFRRDTMESVNEALQIYVIANHILGPRPDFVPRRGEIKIETYTTLETRWDDFSNALVELENVFPFSSEATVSSGAAGPSLLGIGRALYFCIPANDKLLEHWHTVADRLFKIRHCQNIDGVERKLALFAPPIDPGALIQATSQGLSLGSILADLSSPPPIYRFAYLLQKANELCGDVRALGTSLLSALEKKDAEELGRLRASQEIQMQELVTAIRERQVLVAKAGREQLEKARETAAFRLRHYTALLGNADIALPSSPTIGGSLTADSALPADTQLAEVVADIDGSLADGENGVKLIQKEKEELDQLDTARDWQIAAQATEALGAIAHIIPTVSADGKPFGVGGGASFGGTQLGNAINATGKVFGFIASFALHSASTASKMAGYIRREQDWTLQVNLAAKEIIALDKQLVSAAIQVQIAEAELANHKQSIENAKALEQFLKTKFTGQELYQWMKEQLFAVYKQSYNLCYEMAKKAEKAFQYELGTETASFIQYGYWDNSKQGLVAGEKLQLALRQLEKAYLEDNRRELELTKNISLARLDPVALVELRETGRCRVALPEELFDLDFRGHYFRRIRAVRLSIPCVAGPHTAIGCSLRLLGSSIRTNTSMNTGGTYEHEHDAGIWIDDDRFRTSRVPVTAIATSRGQNDSGMFELNFRDERYLPFERAGAISDWQIELSTDKDLRQFDYATISDVIIHLDYTAREDAGTFRNAAATYLASFIENTEDLGDEPFMQIVSVRDELPGEWYRFLHPAVAGSEQVLDFTLGKERFPFFAHDRAVVVTRLELFAKCNAATSYHAIVAYTNRDGDPVTSTQIALPQNATYGNINKVTLQRNEAGLDLEELDIEAPMSLKLKRAGSPDFASLTTSPDEVEDMFLILHYRMA